MIRFIIGKRTESRARIVHSHRIAKLPTAGHRIHAI